MLLSPFKLASKNMTTLIAAYNGNVCIGRCDAKCYNAKQPNCDCICCGMNHGQQIFKAEKNTREHYLQWVDNFENFVLNPCVNQLNIFEDLRT